MHVTWLSDPAEGAPLILVLTGGGEEEKERLLPFLGEIGGNVSYALIGGLDWGRDLSPWPAPGAWKDAPAFTGGADACLKELTEELLPSLQSRLGYEPPWCGIAGYSLAGLFAVYSLYRTDRFARVVSASGSIWYDGFLEYALGHAFAGKPEAVYLSVGKKESRARNRRVAAVGADTRALYEHYLALGIPARFEMNPGGHYQDPEKRLARGISSILTGW